MLNSITDSTESFKNCGSKAYGLAKMKSVGLNVPDFLCIEYDTFFKGYEILEKKLILLFAKYTKELITIEETSKSMISLIQKTEFFSEFIEELNKKTKGYFKEGTLFSVRSSADCEDSAKVSFAGQFETFTNVSIDELPHYIKKCLASVCSVSVLTYLNNQKDIKVPKMNVIIQKMVHSEYSGISFSSNPQGVLSEAIIVVGEGLGENVVSDKIDTTTYYYNKSDDKSYYERQNKSPLLSFEMINSIISSLKIIEEKFDIKYIDMEYAIEDNKLFILQYRPITTINDEKITILDNSNIVESYPGITLPLTESFIKYAYYQIFKGVALRFTKLPSVIQEHEYVFKNMVSSYNGRMYYNINNWYAILGFLPASNKIVPIWQEMLGVSNKDGEFYKAELSTLNQIKIFFNVIGLTMTVTKDMAKLSNDFYNIENFFHENYSEDLDNECLIELYYKLSHEILEKWDITLVNDMYAFLYTSVLKKLLKKKGLKEDEITKYISGMSDLASLKPISEINSLVEMIKNSKDLEDSLRGINSIEGYNKFIKETSDSDFTNKLTKYIDVYGDRCLQELKLETETFKENQLLLIEKLLNYTSLDTLGLGTDTDAPIKVKGTRHIQKRAAIGIANREESRLNRTRIYGFVRRIFLNIGKNLFDMGSLDDGRDVFYLTIEELFNKENAVYKDIVAERKRLYKIYEDLPEYNRLVFSGEIKNKVHASLQTTDYNFEGTLKGIPCSSGIVRGEVLVVTDPNKVKNTEGKILVTKTTDPGWVFLLISAKGIIAEKGSILSHTAIISRELNIPSIVSVKDITRILKDKQLVEMDCSTGIIKIIEDENNEK